MGKRILVVDDDPSFVSLVSQLLTEKEFEVLSAGDGQEALRLLFDYKPELVLLDVVMPGMDGWQTCSRIREISDVPVVILTGKRITEDDIVRGLDYGADEYLIKPVGNKELVARVRAMLRRAELPCSPGARRGTTYGDDYLNVDIADRKIIVKGERVRLTPREFRLFALLVENAGRVLTHKQLLERVWGWEYVDDIDYTRIYISHLRQKIEPSSIRPQYIMTVPGVGYYFQRAA